MQDQDTDETPNLNNLTIIHCDQDPHQRSKLSNTISATSAEEITDSGRAFQLSLIVCGRLGDIFWGCLNFKYFWGALEIPDIIIGG